MYSYIHNHTQIPRPCLRATIHKTEVRGPKTAPFVVYLIHVRTAFTVRGLARRYSDFVLLDAQVRALAQSLNGAAYMIYICIYILYMCKREKERKREREREREKER